MVVVPLILWRDYNVVLAGIEAEELVLSINVGEYASDDSPVSPVQCHVDALEELLAGIPFAVLIHVEEDSAGTDTGLLGGHH